VVGACDRCARRAAAATAEQSFWVIDAARDRAGAAQVIRSITAFSEEVSDDCGGLGVAGVVLFDVVDEGLLELVGELCGGGRRVLGVALPDGALSGDAAWSLLGAGLSDVAAWDGCADGVRLRLERWALVDRLADSTLVAEHMIGCSAVWREVVCDVVEVGFCSDVNVLLCGESGTGKELAARLIHSLDQRPGKAELVLVDCTTIVPSLSGSELFGHERGAFTGAVAARDGAFALADGGTLFLDEVGELPLALQAELLRVVQEGVYKRVGSNRWQRTGFRLVCATNRDLSAECKAGRFRGDLFFRLAAATIRMPALRERPQDILCLAERFLAGRDGAAPALSAPVRELLQARAYPGNVRDLKQLMARIGLRHVGPGPVTVGDVPPSERAGAAGAAGRVGWRQELARALRHAVASGVPLREIVDAAREITISLAVSDADGSLRHAASRLGVTDRTLQLHRKRQRTARVS
jgi:transcriptional regulator with GAF, ATPase, and Fis domain